MRGERFQAREKQVQKLGHDGLVEENKATGEQQRVSKRAADISFGPARPQEETSPRHAEERREDRTAGRTAKKRKKQPRPADAAGPETFWTGALDSVTAVPWSDASPGTAPSDEPESASMRMAVDAPLMDVFDEPEPVAPPIPPPRYRRRKENKKSRRSQAARLTQDAARAAVEDGFKEAEESGGTVRGPNDAPLRATVHGASVPSLERRWAASI